MSQLLNGSICLTDLIERAKQGHSAFTRAKNGKVYFSFTQWVNDKPDQFDNHSSFQLNSSKEKREEEKFNNGGKPIYIGNARIQPMSGEPVSATDADLATADNLPF